MNVSIMRSNQLNDELLMVTVAATKRETATWIVINISKKESLDLI